MMNNRYALEVENVTKKYEGFTLDKVSFSIEKGMVMGLVGENGAGKTTLIKLILNAMDRNEGNIRIFGMDNIKEEVEAKERIGYVSDEDFLLVNSNIKKYAKAFAHVYKNWDQELFEKYARMWKLPAKKKFSEYSKGMKTKAMLALALAHHPDMLILDEPTAGLDPVARIEVLDILREIVEEGERAVLFSTHITGDLDKIADSVTLLIDGKVTESMAIDKIEDKYAVISGNLASLDSSNTKLCTGVRRGTQNFEALVKREYLDRFENVSVHTPNIENLLTFSIWGHRDEIVELGGEDNNG
ncbi:MAG: ABC transporter ATP-binding protein [Oscillospiraceae bacterium]|nr:ABC transporter ATP-binding protein [Oscillospiraceae bacterium]